MLLQNSIKTDATDENNASYKPQLSSSTAEASKTTAKVGEQVQQNTEPDLKDSIASQKAKRREQQALTTHVPQQNIEEDVHSHLGPRAEDKAVVMAQGES